MARAIKHTHALRVSGQMVVILVHVLARQQEDDEDDDSEYQMNSLHLIRQRLLARIRNVGRVMPVLASARRTMCQHSRRENV